MSFFITYTNVIFGFSLLFFFNTINVDQFIISYQFIIYFFLNMTKPSLATLHHLFHQRDYPYL